MDTRYGQRINSLCRPTPTISELEKMITPNLVGSQFKTCFVLFANTVMLCPSTYDGASPDYFSAIGVSNEIDSYDWCLAAFNKLIGCMDTF